MKLITCEFNIDSGCVELRFDDGTELGIDCTVVESEYARHQEHARTVFPHRRCSKYEAPCKGLLFPFASLLHASKAVLPCPESRPLSMV